jgi:NAD-dependent SIR2 family protein deacetylase
MIDMKRLPETSRSRYMLLPSQGLASHQKAGMAIINKDPTPMDQLADYVIHEEAGTVLPQIVTHLK